MNTKGVDMSVFQLGVDYNALAAEGARFSIIRAGIANSEDTALNVHVIGCLNAGIDVGYYWYSYARTVDEARREARECVKAISRYPRPGYPVFFDAEQIDIANALGKNAMTEVALAFIREIEDSGYPSGIYANPSWIETRYNKKRLIESTDNIWLANWTWDPDVPSKYQYGQKMWQWGITTAESTTGRTINIDADISFVDYPAITAQWYAERDKKTVDELALEVINGLWGNGEERRERLTAAGYDYDAVQARVNELLKEMENDPKTTDEIAIEVIQGKWGNGEERRERLTAAGYDYNVIQARVNELLG